MIFMGPLQFKIFCGSKLLMNIQAHAKFPVNALINPQREEGRCIQAHSVTGPGDAIVWSNWRAL